MYPAIQDWRNWLTLNRSAATVAGYVWELTQLANAHPAQGAFDFKAADLTRHLAERRLHGAGDCTLKRALSAYKSFFGWCCGRRKSPAERLPYPHITHVEQRTPTTAQMLATLVACDTSAPAGRRNLAILAIMYDTGIRSSEVCRLALADVDLDACRFKVIVKRRRQSKRVFSEDTRACLAAWLAARALVARPGVLTLFVGISGKTPGEPLTPNGLRRIFHVIGRAAGLADGFSPHDCRRAFATYSHRRGASSRLIQIAGGWEDIRMLEQYTPALTAEDFAPYFPMSGLMATGLKASSD